MVVAISVGTMINMNKTESYTRNVILTNVEALASEQSIGNNCATNILYGGLGMVRYCTTCNTNYFISSYWGEGKCF